MASRTISILVNNRQHQIRDGSKVYKEREIDNVNA